MLLCIRFLSVACGAMLLSVAAAGPAAAASPKHRDGCGAGKCRTATRVVAEEDFSRTRVAKQIATEIMGEPCGGALTTTLAWLPSRVNARATWTWGYAPHFTDCRIVFTTEQPLPWLKFCTIMIHEYGHLVGRTHSDDPESVMYPIYRRPDPRCQIARR